MNKSYIVKNLLFCISIAILEIIILSLTYFYDLFTYQLNWLNYSLYFISWWSIQTDLLLLFFALCGIIYFLSVKKFKFIINNNFILYLVFAAVLTCLFFTVGSIIGAITGEKFTALSANPVIYWISTSVQHWVCPIIFIIYFWLYLDKKSIDLKDFYLYQLYKFYLHPFFYTLFIAIREAVLLILPVDKKMWNYSLTAKNYYVPYFFQDFRHPEYYILYLIVLIIIIALLVTLIVNLNNFLVNRAKRQENK